MAKAYKIFIWKKAPFLRLLLPVIAGIALQFYLAFPFGLILYESIAVAIIYTAFLFLPLAYRYKFQAIGGVLINILLILYGIFLTYNKDIRNHKEWYGNKNDSSAYVIATITEPPVEKNKSIKALVNVESISKEDSIYSTTGKLLIYFEKDSTTKALTYGDRIILKKNLQHIKNSGNPAAFNYARYCAFQQIFYQCYLKRNDYVLLKGKTTSQYKTIIFKTRAKVVNILNQYIIGNDEAALAKALLIGYKVDLDKDLVQAYSNAGVVHLIAISGLHLGLIYGLLLFIIGKISFINKSRFLRLILILFCLWYFAFLTGASASVLRSAVMFSFIATGKAFNKNSSIYNSLAASAFILLCFNPFLLWDVGFQLSYLAVTGIVISQKYIYNWFYFSNKILNKIWALAAVSIAAQIFTLPVCLYYFHQMPLMFLISNLIAIPLATIILCGCILLIFISPLHFIALYTGKILSSIIWLLNHAVLFINKLPFSLWNGVSISVSETFLLYIIFISLLYWLIKKNGTAFKIGICCSLVFASIIAVKRWHFSQQEKMIVYNVTAHKAIDFIHGNAHHFLGDSDLAENSLLQNFNLKPTRISLLATKETDDSLLHQHNNYYMSNGKTILMIDSAINYTVPSEKINIDYIVISKNPKLHISRLAKVFNCGTYIFDASNPLWKIDKWKKDCEELHLHFHSVPEQGAFVTDL
ncbi:MAG: ComEC family competence protein [Bacteroidota bacterium]|nr:ComEC family competence protein [Bacteroidota bacterium]